MNIPRLLLRLLLGSRLPATAGERTVAGLAGPVTIRRDKWGVPYIEAGNDPDAMFALGFCHGQDRAFQLELLVRVVRGTLSEMLGADALGADRMSRRIGFRRAAVAQERVLDADIRAMLNGYANGVTAGRTVGLPRRPHELAILGGPFTPWDVADVLGFAKLQAFALPSNWDVELARLRLIHSDGADAMRAIDPAAIPFSGDAAASERAVRALASDLAALQKFLPPGGGSNNWLVAGSRTQSGKPVLAGDPHLGPALPNPWYLAQIRTPEWAVAGATFPGAPLFPIGHNGFACWSVTAGLTDNSDFFLEPADVPTTVVRETIRVKGRPDVVEDVRVTPRGPILTPLLGDLSDSLALRAVWLDPLPIRGFLDSPRAKSFDEFRQPFAFWPGLPLNVLYADESGATGYQLAGQVPDRATGFGTVPTVGDDWRGYVPFEKMPFVADPPAGFFATANGPPPGDTFLGVDFVDTYRVDRIREVLATRSDWDVPGLMRLQQDQQSRPWAEIREAVLSLSVTDADAVAAVKLLREWDGVVGAESAAAAVFELFVADLCVRMAKALVPNGWRVALGGDENDPLARNLFGDRRVGHLCRLLTTDPAKWSAATADSLAAAVRTLRTKHGPAPAFWQWGDVRPLVLQHLVFDKVRLLRSAFNLGPVPIGGDANTVFQAGALPLNPTQSTHNIPNLRAAFDTADWNVCRFVLAGGQSGNPASPHYDDLFALWQAGDGIPVAWDHSTILRTTTASLRLTPAGGPA